MKNIIVIDQIMGKGKTSWAIQYMREHPDRHFIFVTPFLEEVARIKNSLPELNFFEPDHKKGKSKLESFNSLLMEGRNIVTTHKTFSNATDETVEYLRNGNYVLILDEVLDILIQFNDACKDRISSKDIEILIDKNFISVDKYGKVHWISKDYTGSAYTNVERTAKNGTLYLIDNTFLVWSFPEKIFSLFEDVYVLTYLFNGSYLKPYFEYHNIPYSYKGIAKDENNKYILTEHKDDIAMRAKYKDLISICDNPKMNNFNASSLSKSWYDKQFRKDQLKGLQRMTQNYFQNITKAKAADILWTCPQGDKDADNAKGKFAKRLSGKGYTQRPYTADEKELSDKDRAKVKRDCFLACNARATNDYGDRGVLAYLFNMFPNPYIKRYFESKNEADNTNIHVDENTLALSVMLQWIWRSRIRNNQPIKIWIPSTRMRNLLIDWFGGGM